MLAETSSNRNFVLKLNHCFLSYMRSLYVNEVLIKQTIRKLPRADSSDDKRLTQLACFSVRSKHIKSQKNVKYVLTSS